MKEIKAYIKSIKREAVVHALHQIEGLDGASYSDILGFGRGKENSSGYTPDYNIIGAKHVKVEVACEDALEGEVVSAIHHAAYTGLRGDGRIFVSDVDRSLRIQEAPK